MYFSPLEDALRRFGKREFRPMQRELMECALRGRSCIGILPTGSGKSLCYQIPAVLMDGVAVVVSPPHCADAGPGIGTGKTGSGRGAV